mmetsp:Transcript_41348/g.109688  ORF Transcript_41348/g.109688 Transcript_41348/m.109688 type:complete len:644 (+) Transcript_41348:689-2620(+)
MRHVEQALPPRLLPVGGVAVAPARLMGDVRGEEEGGALVGHERRADGAVGCDGDLAAQQRPIARVLQQRADEGLGGGSLDAQLREALLHAEAVLLVGHVVKSDAHRLRAALAVDQHRYAPHLRQLVWLWQLRRARHAIRAHQRALRARRWLGQHRRTVAQLSDGQEGLALGGRDAVGTLKPPTVESARGRFECLGGGGRRRRGGRRQRGGGAATVARRRRRRRLLAHDDVDNLAGHVDELLDLLVADKLGDLLVCEGELARHRLVGVERQLDLAAHLSVDLHAHRDGRLDALGLIELGPWRVRERSLVAEQLPHLLAEVRRHRREEEGEVGDGLGGQLFERGEVGREDHHLRDGRVERHRVDVARHLADGLVHQPLRLLAHGRPLGDSAREGVDALLEAHDARDLLGLPRLDRLERAHEHLVEPHRIRAVRLDNVVGVDDVAARLGHLLAVGAEDHALVDELLERLLGRHQPEVVQHLVPEARVEEVEDGVLCATDVQVDRQPRLLGFGRDERVAIVWVGEAQVVPARARPLRHRVGLARVPGAVFLEVAPVEHTREAALRVVARFEVLELRQLDRQLGLVDCLGRREVDRVRVALARVAVRIAHLDGEEDGDRLAPVALPREDPVAQLVAHLGLAGTRADEL